MDVPGTTMDVPGTTTRVRRTIRLAAVGLFAVSLGLTTVACGSEQQAPDAVPSAATGAPDGSIPVVGGPSPESTSASETAERTPDDCGMTGGPDGALHVRLAGGDISCETAMQIAREYSPLIATGQPQTVSGWNCGPSAQLPGELARCTKDGQVIAFTAS